MSSAAMLRARFGALLRPRALLRAAHTSSLASGDVGAPACLLAILQQHKAFLTGLDDDVYTFVSPLLEGSIGGHTRHSLDHLRKPLELLAAQSDSGDVVHYDLRERHTAVETDRQAAIQQIEALEETLRAVAGRDLGRRVDAAFMLASDGREFVFESTFSRELAFAVHHCIHHNALSKVLLRHHFPALRVPEDFGMAPSTANYNLHHE